MLEYIERIQATLDPYQGRFLVHGVEVDVKEGPWPGTAVVVEFPDLAAAQAWYDSPAYQAILPLRTDHVESSLFVKRFFVRSWWWFERLHLASRWS